MCSWLEKEGVCRILCETKKEYLFVEKQISFDATETDDKIIKYEALIGCNDKIFPFARGEKYIFHMLHRK